MRSNTKFLYIAFVFAGLIGFSTYGMNNTTQVLASHSAAGDNMTGMAGMTNMSKTEHTYNKSANVVRDSVAELLEGKTIPAGKFIHLYDSTPYLIGNGHIAVNLPCEDNSIASLNMLIGQAPNLTTAELENVPELSTPGTLCLYHVDIPPQNLTVTDIAIQNPGDSDEVLPPGSTVVIGVNEIVPGSEHHEEGE
jgi:hypothetical protein